MPAIRPYDPVRRVEILEDMWTATKGSHILRCELRTNPLGWELRALVSAQIQRSQVCKTEAEVFATSDGWRAEAEAKGWTQPVAGSQ